LIYSFTILLKFFRKAIIKTRRGRNYLAYAHKKYSLAIYTNPYTAAS